MKNKVILPRLRAFILGVRDGWNQPYEINSSANVGHLYQSHAIVMGSVSGVIVCACGWKSNHNAWAGDSYNEYDNHISSVEQNKWNNDAYEWQDRGINIGQFLRKGRKSQSYTMKWWPFSDIEVVENGVGTWWT